MQNSDKNTSPCQHSQRSDHIISFQAFCEGLPTSHTSESLSDSSYSHSQYLCESVLEPDSKIVGQTDAFSPKHPLRRLDGNIRNFCDRSGSSEENEIPFRLIHNNNQIHRGLNATHHFGSLARSQASTSEGLNNRSVFENSENRNPAHYTPKPSLSEIMGDTYCVDFSVKELPMTPPFSIYKNGKNPGINYMQPETLVTLMNASSGIQVILLDCRYKYEYNGGHIKGAKSVTSRKDLKNILFTFDDMEERRAALDFISQVNNNPEENDEDGSIKEKRIPIIVFYCESSMKRGPRGCRVFRDLDRELDTNVCPSPYYPYVYVLKGGYKEFHAQYPEYCGGYVETLDIKYNSERYQAKEEEKTAWEAKVEFDVNNPETFALKRLNKKKISWV